MNKMRHRRSHSESDIVSHDPDMSDSESVSSSSTDSVHTVDLYTGWRFPEISFTVKLPGWFVVLVTLLLFKGPASCDA